MADLPDYDYEEIEDNNSKSDKTIKITEQNSDELLKMFQG